MRVLFMGTPEYAATILERLLKEPDIEVVAVVTQPDKKVGRKQQLTPPAVKISALEAGIEVLQPQRLRDAGVETTIGAYHPDFIVVAAFGQILPKTVLDIAPCINLHASILPQYRGASPIQQSLLNDDASSGVTAMLMNEGLDTGDILAVTQVDISPDMMLETLYETLTEAAAELTPFVLKRYNALKPLPQSSVNATHCSKIVKREGEIHFDDAKTIYNRYRAFTPWPGIYLASGLKIKTMNFASDKGEYQAGEIVEILEESVRIGCEKGSLIISKVQPPSKKAMPTADYINGKRLNVGDILL